jgi:transcriptional regulator with XRE-family HTH domain
MTETMPMMPPVNSRDGDPRTLGARIRMALQRKGWSGRQLARQLGVAPRAVMSWIHDTNRPSLDRLPVLCATLGVSLEWLLTGRGPMTARDNRDLKLIAELICEMDPDSYHELMAVVYRLRDRLRDRLKNSYAGGPGNPATESADRGTDRAGPPHDGCDGSY